MFSPVFLHAILAARQDRQTESTDEDPVSLHLQWIKLKIYSWTPKALPSQIPNLLPTYLLSPTPQHTLLKYKSHILIFF